jgi:hypothetical protein
MISRRITTLAGIFLLWVVSAPAGVIAIGPSAFGQGAVRLTFDELTSPTLLDGTYAARGVVFSNAMALTGAFPVSQPNVIMAVDLSSPIVIDFPAGVAKVGIQIDTDGYEPDRQPQIRAYDLAGNLVGTLLFGQGPDFQGFMTTSGLISRLQVGACHPVGVSTCSPLAYSDSYDNLIFESDTDSAARVPEPATVAEIAIGLAGLLAARVIRQRRVRPPAFPPALCRVTRSINWPLRRNL